MEGLLGAFKIGLSIYYNAYEWEFLENYDSFPVC